MIDDLTIKGLIDFCEAGLSGMVEEREVPLLLTACREVAGALGAARAEEPMGVEAMLGALETVKGRYSASTFATYRSRFRKVARLYGEVSGNRGVVGYIGDARGRRDGGVGAVAADTVRAAKAEVVWREYLFPVRGEDDATLRLPRDLTEREAERLAAFVKALVL